MHLCSWAVAVGVVVQPSERAQLVPDLAEDMVHSLLHLGAELAVLLLDLLLLRPGVALQLSGLVHLGADFTFHRVSGVYCAALRPCPP